MPNSPFYAPGTNWNPGDWPGVLDQQAANEKAFTEGEGQELSSAVQVSEAEQTDLDISGDARLWPFQLEADEVGAPSTLTPDIQGNQKSQTPYVENHLYQ